LPTLGPLQVTLVTPEPGERVVGGHRIGAAFGAARDRGRRAALMPFLMGGFPTLDVSRAIGEAYVDAGADLVELGVPFADAVADGPMIRSAGSTALRAGATLAGVLDVARALSVRAPVVLMCYHASIRAAGGARRFADALASAGASGVIVPDVPHEGGAALLEACDEAGVALVPVVVPTTDDDGLARIKAQARGFLYTVSATGTTGERATLAGSVPLVVRRAKAGTSVPVALGFGISTPEHARQAAAAGADGVIVGSRLVRAATEATDPAAAVGALVAELAAALRDVRQPSKQRPRRTLMHPITTDRSARPASAIVDVAGRRIGGDGFAVIAGPCAVETRDQTLRTATAVQRAGATLFRGGVYKPRSSPHSFQGLGAAGLELLVEARGLTGLPIVTEVVDARDVEMVAGVVDMIQIGARNMQNYALLTEVGRSGAPALLKRGLSATIDELLLASEYVLNEGNEQVVLCERGIRTFESAYRFTLDLTAIPVLIERSHLPVIVDPSHAAGRRDWVLPLSLAAAAVGAAGVIVEVHPDPDTALCDGPQAIPALEFAAFVQRVLDVADVARPNVAMAPSQLALAVAA
jgi:3-deoxy-7-phosphoheptulonate synthase